MSTPAERPSRQQFRRMLEAQLRYYQAMNQVTSDYLRSVLGAFEELLDVLGPISVRPSSTFVDSVAAAPHVRPMALPSASGPPALVLEAPAGGEAVGVFLAENRLGRRVSAPIVASVFTDPTGREVRPQLTFEPSEINLGEGERVLVQVGLTVDGDLEPGVDHRGEVTVPGLPGGLIRLVVRRHPDRLKRSVTPRRSSDSATKKALTRGAESSGASARRALPSAAD